MKGSGALALALLLGCASDVPEHAVKARSATAAAPARVALLELSGAVQPAAQRSLERALRAALRR